MKNLCLKFLSYSCGSRCVPGSALSPGAVNSSPLRLGSRSARWAGGRCVMVGRLCSERWAGWRPWAENGWAVTVNCCVRDAEGRCSREPTGPVCVPWTGCALVLPEDRQDGKIGAGMGSVEVAKPKGFLVIRKVCAVHLPNARHCRGCWNKPPSSVQGNETKPGHGLVGCGGD